MQPYKVFPTFAAIPAIAIALLLGTGTVLAAPRVELELITEPGFPPTGAQRWLAALKDIGFSDVRIRQARAGDQVAIRQRGSDTSPSYQVTGLLTTNETLQLPGGTFRMGDTAGLKQWLAKVREGGERRLQEQVAAFGLTPTQLVAVHEALARPVTFSTQGQPAFSAMKRIADSLSLSFLSDAGARRIMAGDHLVADQLQGLAAGTALVAILRPLGLVLVPQKDAAGKIQLWIKDVRDTRESWPVGWPPQESPRETAPKLFTFLNVEIQDTPLTDALNAVSGRIEMPLLYDHNSLARQRIDLAQVNVSLPPGRNYYLGIIDGALRQAQLISELRVDEAGTPFLWISTLKR
jgi:hypothetical protein